MRSFVGRSAELSLLHQRLARAVGGSAQTVLLQGEPGMGKTALLAAFTDSVVGARTFRASGDEAEAFLPYGVLLQVMRRQEAPWSNPLAAGAELLRFLDERPATGPTLFVVDDAHLVDTASLDALTFALR